MQTIKTNVKLSENAMYKNSRKQIDYLKKSFLKYKQSSKKDDLNFQPSDPNLQPPPIYQSNYSNQQSIFTTIINDVVLPTTTTNPQNPVIEGVLEEIKEMVFDEKHPHFPLFCINKNVIKIPSKVHNTVKHINKALLKKIHPDVNVAHELCLLFIAELNSTYFDWLKSYETNRWKRLHSKYLKQYFNSSPTLYRFIREALTSKLKKGPIIECDYTHIKGKKSFCYKLGDAYFGKGLKDYTLTTPEAQKYHNNKLFNKYCRSVKNPICRNLISFYHTIELPTENELYAEAKRLKKNKHITKKGKELTFLNKHSRDYFINPSERSFVEHNIELFHYLTENGLMIPIEGNDASGGRVVDSLTLMPSWIRNLIKVDGKYLTECDFACLHPNIAMQLYGGSKEYLNHNDVAIASNIDVKTVKMEHLSFFNKEVWQMKKSPLYDYYLSTEPQMLRKIEQEKYNSVHKHKITSRKMFKKEVDIMTEVIQILSKENISVGYIYDALICHPDNADRVKVVMDEVCLKHGVKTIAKMSKK